MLKKEYYESIEFGSGSSFIVSSRIDAAFVNKLHWHPFVEILVSLADGNEVDINFTRHPMHLNDIAIIYPGDLHAVRQSSDESLLIIQFPNTLLTTLSALGNNISLLSQYPIMAYDPCNAACERNVLLMKEFYEAYNSDAPFREVRMYALILQFFERVGNACLNARQSVPDQAEGKNRTTKKMAEACLYISQNCTQPLTLNDVADYMGVSRSYFAHLFKQFTNMTFVDFLTEERIKRAKALFLKPDMQIIDIAFESGFSSISSFNRAFKKITGLSPSRFRENVFAHQGASHSTYYNSEDKI